MKQLHYIVCTAVVVVAVLIYWSCGDSPTKSDGGDVIEPHSPSPRNQAQGVSRAVTLSWDTDLVPGDSTSFDLYFGTTDPPWVYRPNLRGTHYTLGELAGGHEYFWRVEVIDTGGVHAISPVWHFTTNSEYVYPFVEGDMLAYEGGSSVSDVRPPSLEEMLQVHVFHLASLVTVDSTATWQDSVQAFYLSERIIASQSETVSDTDRCTAVYVNQQDGLYLQDYSGPIGGASGMLFSPARTGKLAIAESPLALTLVTPDFSGISLGSLTPPIDIPVPPFKSLAYPLETGAEWTYKTLPGLFTISKEVTAEEDISTPLGTFPCWVVRWQYTDAYGLPMVSPIITDYIGELGLVKRVIFVDDANVTSYESPEIVGTADFTVVLTLVERYRMVQ